MKVRSHAPRQFPAVKGSFTMVKVSPVTAPIIECLQAHFILMMSFCSLYPFTLIIMNIPVSLLHTFVVDTVLTFPTPFNIILAYNKTSRVNAITQAYYTKKMSSSDAKCHDCA